MKAIICIPTYNERKNIGDLIALIRRETQGMSLHILVIDSASPDGSADASPEGQPPRRRWEAARSRAAARDRDGGELERMHVMLHTLFRELKSANTAAREEDPSSGLARSAVWVLESRRPFHLVASAASARSDGPPSSGSSHPVRRILSSIRGPPSPPPPSGRDGAATKGSTPPAGGDARAADGGAIVRQSLGRAADNGGILGQSLGGAADSGGVIRHTLGALLSRSVAREADAWAEGR